jgi:uncharacterized protein (TIGR00730 family)
MSQNIQAITVYAASSNRIPSVYIEAAKDLGRLLASHSITCVYGGGPNGLMGAVSNTVMENGGKVLGVIPQFMVDRAWLNTKLTDVIVTPDMHTRKQIMTEKSDACIALPGGIGTMEELLEIIAWRQLGLYLKPVVILNTNGFYDFLFDLLQKIVTENFMHHESYKLWSVAKNPEEALEIIIEQIKNPINPLL